MREATLLVLSSTNWSEAAGEDPDRGRTRSGTQPVSARLAAK